jgi:hypothetical protein
MIDDAGGYIDYDESGGSGPTLVFLIAVYRTGSSPSAERPRQRRAPVTIAPNAQSRAVLGAS